MLFARVAFMYVLKYLWSHLPGYYDSVVTSNEAWFHGEHFPVWPKFMKICWQVSLFTRETSVNVAFEPSKFLILCCKVVEKISSGNHHSLELRLWSYWQLLLKFYVDLWIHGSDSAEDFCYWNVHPFLDTTFNGRYGTDLIMNLCTLHLMSIIFL